MTALVLVIPIILVRYGLLSLVSKDAMARAAFFPPTRGVEKAALIVYQVMTLFLLIYPAFARIYLASPWNYLGGFTFLGGMVLYILAVLDFATLRGGSLNRNGLYRWSRNPMYVAFFLYFLGISLLINSWLYLAVLMVFQVSMHFLILSEERWCCLEFGQDYQQYLKDVRRYF